MTIYLLNHSYMFLIPRTQIIIALKRTTSSAGRPSIHQTIQSKVSENSSQVHEKGPWMSNVVNTMQHVHRQA